MSNIYVWTVTYWTEDLNKEPTISVFDNEEAAQKCYEFFRKEYKGQVCIDCAPLYTQFLVYGPS